MVTWLGELLFIFKMLPDIGFLRCMGLGGEGPTIQFFLFGKKRNSKSRIRLFRMSSSVSLEMHHGLLDLQSTRAEHLKTHKATSACFI